MPGVAEAMAVAPSAGTDVASEPARFVVVAVSVTAPWWP
jgi:hypothetical protein